MFNELVSSFTHIPELRKIKHKINTSCYWLGGASTLKVALSETTVNSNPYENKTIFEMIMISRFRDDIREILKSVYRAKNIFVKIPLKLQLKHIFNIPRCINECTFMEDYKISSNACECVMLNHLMMTYAEIILPKLQGKEKTVFLTKLENNLHKGGFLGAKFYEEDHLIVLNKWQLENELFDNNSPKPKKVTKI